MNNAIKRVVVSDEDLYYFLLINSWGPGQGVCIFGIITNILNIITFVKQGIQDTVNISLLGLATSDLGSQITLLYANLNVIPAFVALDLPFEADDIMYINGLCHVIFTRVSAWITAYITLERCLCVTLPLKVKNVFTPNRTVLYLNLMYIIMFASVFPCFYTMRPAKVFDPLRNRTILRILYVEGRKIIENITFVTNNVIPSIALCLIVICTAVLVVNLRQKSKWRRKVTSDSSKSSVAMSNRDSKAVKMVVLIAAIFIMCYVPSMIAFLYILLDPDTRIDGYQRNLCCSLFAVFFHLESINAGVNTFVLLQYEFKV
ncbi:unnamed protein product [Candidula unifasciata]|uniref:G-protein coupled receptors family 1 profile domain-containing protein n=1 Tax=Candidula unifasciata TaxID=100452 RepID=A0A8S3YPS7_9EUPU|nr:unnamed protein product [Candidula unifasciata]